MFCCLVVIDLNCLWQCSRISDIFVVESIIPKNIVAKKNTSKLQTNSLCMSGAQKWLSRFHAIIDKNLSNPSLNNEQLALTLLVSERHLFRKVKELSGMSPQKYLKHYRLQKAERYLKNGKYRTVKETSFAIGFRNSSYFIREFEKVFGVKPLQVLQEEGWR